MPATLITTATTEIYTLSLHDALPICRFAGPSRSRRGGWVSVGNVCYQTNQATPFEEEVTGCFRELQGSFMSAQEVLL